MGGVCDKLRDRDRLGQRAVAVPDRSPRRGRVGDVVDGKGGGVEEHFRLDLGRGLGVDRQAPRRLGRHALRERCTAERTAQGGRGGAAARTLLVLGGEAAHDAAAAEDVPARGARLRRETDGLMEGRHAHGALDVGGAASRAHLLQGPRPRVLSAQLADGAAVSSENLYSSVSSPLSPPPRFFFVCSSRKPILPSAAFEHVRSSHVPS